MSDPGYDLSIHHNPDAVAWAKFFIETQAKLGNPPLNESVMVGWFANAMMAMYDFERNKTARKETPDE